MLSLTLVVLAATNPYSKILNFVRDADVVTTYITHRDIEVVDFKFPSTARLAHDINLKDPTSKFQIVGLENRKAIVSFLKHVSDPKPGIVYACFEPHHFVYAVKGKKHELIQICFTCNRVEATGAYEYNSGVVRGLRLNADKIFGLKFDPMKVKALPEPSNLSKESSSMPRVSGGK